MQKPTEKPLKEKLIMGNEDFISIEVYSEIYPSEEKVMYVYITCGKYIGIGPMCTISFLLKCIQKSIQDRIQAVYKREDPTHLVSCNMHLGNMQFVQER